MLESRPKSPVDLPPLKPHQQASKLMAVGVYGAALLGLLSLPLTLNWGQSVLRGDWGNFTHHWQEVRSHAGFLLFFVGGPMVLGTLIFAIILYRIIPPIPATAQRRLVIVSLVDALLFTPLISALLVLGVGFCLIRFLMANELLYVVFGLAGFGILFWFSQAWFLRRMLKNSFELHEEQSLVMDSRFSQ